MPNIPAELQGCKLFPVLPGDKLPALSYGWQNRATADQQQIADWDRGMDNLNWGVAAGSSNLFIFDIDPQGRDAWEKLQNDVPGLRQAVSASYTVRTPRGGYHHYFRGQGPTTASAIAPGIDTRGGYIDERTGKWKSLGYVVTPGSRTSAGPKTVDGAYEALGGTIVPMPPAVLQIVPDRKKGAAVGLPVPVVPDNPRNVQWARDLLNTAVATGDVSVEGAGGDNTLYKICARLLDKGISPATAYQLLEEIWNPHCNPPWEDWELEKKLSNAMEYGDETQSGDKGFQTNEDAFANFAGKDFGPDEAVVKAERKRSLMLIHDYAATVKDPEWLIKDYLPAQGTGIVYGFSGSYKSFLALDWALCLSYGHPGQWMAPPVKNDVIYFCGESPRGMAKLRKPAWQEHEKKIEEDHRFFFYPYVPAYADAGQWEDIRNQIAELQIRPKLIVIDTMTRLLTGMDENSAKDANMITRFLEDLASHYDCFVLVVHHTGKDEGRGARGSSVFYANLDTALYLKKRGEGVALIVKNHKEADPVDGEILMKPVISGKSIVLKQTDHLADDDKAEASRGGTSKISWSDPGEISERIHKAGGEMSTANLIMDILGDYPTVHKMKVVNELQRRGDIQWLRKGDTWKLPGKLEHDL